MQAPYFIGIDIGTTAIKAVAFNEQGEALHRCTATIETLQPQTGYKEQVPSQIWKEFVQVLTQLCNHFSDPPQAVGLSAAMHSIALFDTHVHALTPFVIWSDERSSTIATELHQKDLSQSIYEATGTPVHPMSPLCKWIWWQQSQPELLQQTMFVGGIKEYIWQQLFNEWVTDTSTASATGFFNIHQLRWEENVLQRFQLSAQQLPVIQPMRYNKLLPLNTALPAMLHNVPFVLGGTDGVLAAWAGVQTSDLPTSLSIGTSAALRSVVDGAQLNEQQKTFCYHMQDKQYVVGGPSNNGLIVLQWLKNEVLKTDVSYEELIDAAAQITPGSDGLFFLPYLQGERAPHWTKKLSAEFIGLTNEHSTAQRVRAVLEGMAYNLKWIGETMGLKPLEDLFTTGGLVPFREGMQLVADVLNYRLHATDDGDGVAFGAAGIAASAVGSKMLAQQAVHIFKPDPERADFYQLGFQQFKKTFRQQYP